MLEIRLLMEGYATPMILFSDEYIFGRSIGSLKCSALSFSFRPKLYARIVLPGSIWICYLGDESDQNPDIKCSQVFLVLNWIIPKTKSLWKSTWIP